jgi:dTDP-glucose pyrophosphorylase
MNNRLILTKNTSLNNAIQLLDKNGNGILPVINKLNKLIGIITDGDIRKAILDGQLELERIVNKKPVVINKSASTIQKIQLLKRIQRLHLPVVDDENNFIEIFTLDRVNFLRKPNWVFIMAGGLGSRLGELTKDTPKPMLCVAGKPILERIIESFVKQGFVKFYLSVNYKKEMIKSYFKNGDDMGIEIKYIEEKKRLGTAGALSLLEDKDDNPLLVINGDILTSMDYNYLLDYHNNKKMVATMCIREYSHSIPYGVIEIKDGEITSMTEKPEIKFNINTGVYVLDNDALDNIPRNAFYDMTTLLSTLMGDNFRVGVYQLKDYWIDVGRPDDFYKADCDLKSKS